ncbi:hypothetical protein B0H19DRAFT_1248680 [Mycena capillaripes]|nr:hypothetical protein B0H19DRAFT_1248680 [Mycena capillaripes]
MQAALYIQFIHFCLSHLGIHLIFRALLFLAGEIILHRGRATFANIARETLDLTIRISTHTTIASAIIAILPLLPCIPLSFSGSTSNVSASSPANSSGSLTRGPGSLSTPASAPRPGAHRKAAVLAPLFQWFGLVVYGTLIIWFRTSWVGRYLFEIARLIGRLGVWALPALAWTTLVAFTVFWLDFLGYWVYSYWAWRLQNEQLWKTPVDVMALYVFEFTVRDLPGWREKDLRESEKKAKEPELDAGTLAVPDTL